MSVCAQLDVHAAETLVLTKFVSVSLGRKAKVMTNKFYFKQEKPLVFPPMHRWSSDIVLFSSDLCSVENVSSPDFVGVMSERGCFGKAEKAPWESMFKCVKLEVIHCYLLILPFIDSCPE